MAISSLQISPLTLVRVRVVDAAVGGGTRVEHPFTVRAEQTSGAISSLLFAEPDVERIVRLNLTTDQRTTISGGSGVGGGPALSRLIDFVPDTRAPANGGVLFGLLSSPGNSLVSIDIATGNRTSLTALAAATQPRNLRLDATGNRVQHERRLQWFTGGLYAIQLPGFAQSAVSSSATGSGTTFTGPSTFVLDPETNPNRALLVDLNPSRWLQVNLASGARSVFTTAGGNPSLPLLGPLHFDGANSQVYGLNLYPPHLFVTTVAPGGVEVGHLISGQVPGSMGIIGGGPLVDFGAGLFVDTTRNVAFVSESTAGAIMAIDLASGDRVDLALSEAGFGLDAETVQRLAPSQLPAEHRARIS